jgi:hypothetical protein
MHCVGGWRSAIKRLSCQRRCRQAGPGSNPPPSPGDVTLTAEVVVASSSTSPDGHESPAEALQRPVVPDSMQDRARPCPLHDQDVRHGSGHGSRNRVSATATAQSEIHRRPCRQSRDHCAKGVLALTPRSTTTVLPTASHEAARVRSSYSRAVLPAHQRATRHGQSPRHPQGLPCSCPGIRGKPPLDRGDDLVVTSRQM